MRTALQPRWLALLALVVVVVAAFVRLGLWQLDVAESKGASEAVTASERRPAAPLTSVLAPHAAFPADGSNRTVTMTGTYAADGQLLVTPRRLHGVTGSWVVTPLRVAPSGATIAVLRGFVTDPAAAGPPPAGPVTVRGTLAPGESPTAGPALPDGALGSVDLAVLVNRWPGDLYNAFVFAGSEATPGGSPVALTPGLERVPTPPLPSGLQWRNAAYALQWWIFAAFAVWMWVKMVRDDRLAAVAARESGADAEPVAVAGEDGPHD